MLRLSEIVSFTQAFKICLFIFYITFCFLFQKLLHKNTSNNFIENVKGIWLNTWFSCKNLSTNKYNLQYYSLLFTPWLPITTPFPFIQRCTFNLKIIIYKKHKISRKKHCMHIECHHRFKYRIPPYWISLLCFRNIKQIKRIKHKSFSQKIVPLENLQIYFQQIN